MKSEHFRKIVFSLNASSCKLLHVNLHFWIIGPSSNRNCNYRMNRSRYVIQKVLYIVVILDVGWKQNEKLMKSETPQKSVLPFCCPWEESWMYDADCRIVNKNKQRYIAIVWVIIRIVEGQIFGCLFIGRSLLPHQEWRIVEASQCVAARAITWRTLNSVVYESSLEKNRHSLFRQ